MANDLVSWIFLLLGMKSKSLAGLIDWAVSSLSFCFLCSIIWKCKWLGGSPNLLCHLLLHVRWFVCCSQPLRLTHSLNYSDRWHFLERSGLFWFFLTNCPCCSLAEERIQCWLLAEPCLYLSVILACLGSLFLQGDCHTAFTPPHAAGHCFPVLKDNTGIKVYRDICCAQLSTFSTFAPTSFTPFSVLTHSSTAVLRLFKHDFKTGQHLWVFRGELLLFTGCRLSCAQPLWTCNSAVSWTSPSRAVVFHLCN